MGSKFYKKIQSTNMRHKKILKVKKDLKKSLNKLHSLDFAEKDDIVKSVLNLSKKCDEIILDYNNLQEKDKS